MRIGPLTYENIEEVFSDPSMVTVKDAWVLNFSLDYMKQGFIDMMGKPFTGAFYRDNECCALVMLRPIGEKAWCVFLADKNGKLSGITMSMTRFLRRMSDDLVNKNGAYIEFFSRFRGGKSSKWFRAMGFVAVPGDSCITKWTKGVINERR